MISSMPTASPCRRLAGRDRKSTRLNSSHLVISYAVFCLKKKKIDTLISYHQFNLHHGSRPNIHHHIGLTLNQHAIYTVSSTYSYLLCSLLDLVCGIAYYS